LGADLVKKELVNGTPERLETLEKVSKYCGKPLLPENDGANSTEAEEHFTWDFYNSFFVAVTIVSTIGLIFFRMEMKK
jgi:hypothetical protein